MKKQKYGLISNVIYLYKELFSFEKSTKFTFPISVLTKILLPAITLVIPSAAVYAIENQLAIEQFFLIMAGLILVYAAVKICDMLAQGRYSIQCTVIRCYRFSQKLLRKVLTMDFINCERNENQKLIGRAKYAALASNWTGIERVYKELPNVLFNAAGLILYGGAILSVDYKILLVLFFMLISNIFTNRFARNYINKHMEENTEINRKINYLSNNTCKMESGKDIRIFHMEKWFSKLFERYIEKGDEWQKKVEKHFYLPSASDAVFLALRDGIAYYILIQMVFRDEISLAGFTFMLGIIVGFSDWLFGLMSGITELLNADKAVVSFREALDLPDSFLHEEGVKVTRDFSVPPKIELKNVTFRYKEEERNVLSNISLTIQPGEKIALVGGNGAGKTTLVKLLCGFYHPTEGEILINGISIEEYNIEEYYKIIGAVFQDAEHHVFRLVNIVSGKEKEETDMKKFWQSIEQVGLKEKIEQLDNKEDTYLSQVFHDKGIQLSGGEMQKLMMARCIYKDAPFMILDEPTSALDPIAESRIYEEYSRLTNNKTSIFISHRLASTRFCDKILFLENGKIIEEGSHKELIEKNGRYAKIYEIQSHYYKENGKQSVDMEASYE